MKKFFKILGIVLGCVVILILGFLGYLKMHGFPKFSEADLHRPNIHVQSSPDRIARGAKIVHLLCYDCHYNPSTNRLTGHYLPEMPAVFGKIYSHNITNDKTNGIGSWSDGEILYFLRTGIHKNNEYVPPYMPKFPNVSEEDLQSVIAYLRSDDSLVAPHPAMDTAEEPSMLALFLGNFVFKPLPYPTTEIPNPPANNAVAVGKYWATGVIGCYQCHSADFKTNDEMVPEKSVGYFGGGNEMNDAMGKPIYTANITMSPEHGIGKWSKETFLRALRDGIRPDNRALRYPMARFPELTDSEIVCIFEYLKTVPVQQNVVNRNTELKYVNADPSEGAKVYYKYACYACHGQNGIGMCDLTKACRKYHSDEELIAWIKNPSKLNPGTKMPTWEGTIKEDEFAPLAQYVRQLGNQASNTAAGGKSTAKK
ncbi:MAG: c-type cytochrome [Bacteroidetes bacterium]|nr:c-type cytochrome [Bacteroidota bacterium]